MLAVRGADGVAGELALAAIPAVLLTSSLGSHAAAVPGWSPLAIAADWLHFTAVATWLGGLARQTGAQPAAVDRTIQAEGLSGRVRISPASVGQNHFAVEVANTNPAAVERVQLTLTYLDVELGSAPVILAPSTDTPATWEADSPALSQPGQWQADLLVRRQGQDDVRSTLRFAVAVQSAAAPGDTAAAYPPVPAWIPLALGGGVAFMVVCVAVFMLLNRRSPQAPLPLNSENLRGLLRGGTDPFESSDGDRRRDAVGATSARPSAQTARRDEPSGE